MGVIFCGGGYYFFYDLKQGIHTGKASLQFLLLVLVLAVVVYSIGISIILTFYCGGSVSTTKALSSENNVGSPQLILKPQNGMGGDERPSWRYIGNLAAADNGKIVYWDTAISENSTVINQHGMPSQIRMV